MGTEPGRLWLVSPLALALAAGRLLHLGLVLAASAGALAFGWCRLACRALDLLALNLVGNAAGVCHGMSCAFLKKV